MSADAKLDELASGYLLGKDVEDLQENIKIMGYNISGTLKHISGWTEFSGKPEEQEGNYIALHFATPDVADSTISVELVGGDYPGKKFVLDEDGIIICRIKNTSETIKVTASKEGLDPVVRVYTLSGLTLQN